MHKDLSNYQAYSYFAQDSHVKSMRFKGEAKNRVAHLLLDQDAPTDKLLGAIYKEDIDLLDKLTRKILAKLGDNCTLNQTMIDQVSQRFKQIKDLKDSTPSDRTKFSIQQILKITKPAEREAAMRCFLDSGGTLAELANYVVELHANTNFNQSLQFDFEQACLAIADGRKILQNRNVTERLFSLFSKLTGNDDETQALNLLKSIIAIIPGANLPVSEISFDDPQLFKLACDKSLPGLARLSLEYRKIDKLPFSDLLQYASRLGGSSNFYPILEYFDQRGALSHATLENKVTFCHTLLDVCCGSKYTFLPPHIKIPAIQFVLKVIDQYPELQADEELLKRCAKEVIDCNDGELFEQFLDLNLLDIHQASIKVKDENIPLLSYIVDSPRTECIKVICERDPENRAMHKTLMRKIVKNYFVNTKSLPAIDYMQKNLGLHEIWAEEFGPLAHILQPYLDQLAGIDREETRQQMLEGILLILTSQEIKINSSIKGSSLNFAMRIIKENPKLSSNQNLMLGCFQQAIKGDHPAILQELIELNPLDLQQACLKFKGEEVSLLTYMGLLGSAKCLKLIFENHPSELSEVCMQALLQSYARENMERQLRLIDDLIKNFPMENLWENVYGPEGQFLKPILNQIMQQKDDRIRLFALEGILKVTNEIKNHSNSQLLFKSLLPLISQLGSIPNSLVMEQKAECLLAFVNAANRLKITAEEFEKNMGLLNAIFNYRNPANRMAMTKALFALYEIGAEEDLAKWQQVRDHIKRNSSTKKEAWFIPALLLVPFLHGTEPLKNQTFEAFFNIKTDMYDGAKLQALAGLLLQLKDQTSINKANDWLQLAFGANRAERKSCWHLLATICNMGWGKQLETLSTFSECEKLLQSHLSQAFNLKLDDLESKYRKTIGTFKEPTILLTYQARLQKLHQSDYQKFHVLIAQFVTGILEGTYPAMRYAMTNAHLNMIFNDRQKLLAEWQKGEQLSPKELLAGKDKKINDKWQVVDTDDPEDMILMGNVQGSCLNIMNGENSRCLINYILDGKNRLIAVKDNDGNIIGRCILRILWDDKAKEPVLFRENFYINNQNKAAKSLLKAMCEKRAQALGLPLLAKNNLSKRESQASDYHSPACSLANLSDEYVDALGGIMHGPYKIEGAKLIYHPQSYTTSGH